MKKPVSEAQPKPDVAPTVPVSEVARVVPVAPGLSNGSGPKVRTLTDIHLYPLKSCGAFKVRV